MYSTNLNKNTQKAKRWIDSYNNSTCYSVNDFYGRCSSRKISIEEKIKHEMIENNCHDYRILGGGSSFFTCAYKNEDNSILYIETIGNRYSIIL